MPKKAPRAKKAKAPRTEQKKVGPKRLSIEIERDRAIIARLYCSGLFQSQIPEKLQQETGATYLLSRQQICYEIKKVKDAWSSSAIASMDERLNIELEKIDAREWEAWQAWKRSQEDKVQIKEKADVVPVSEEDGEVSTVSRKVERTIDRVGQVGDPRFLAILQACSEQRCKLLGLYKPVKVAPTDPEGDKPYEIEEGPKVEQRVIAVLVAIAEQSKQSEQGQTESVGEPDHQ